ncbi:MAG TPA: MipA/OmpV family protein [Steroidobacteraceae bacterium]|jgi:outer membrane scaffolding protein for murein synthesis (MipA/OmpV family)
MRTWLHPQWIFCFVALFGLGALARGQTPSPLQEWQYSSGIVLERMFEPAAPQIRAVAGVGAELLPAYDGSRAYRVRGGPAIDLRFKDVAFISTGDGVGYNIVHERRLVAGVSLAYDLGRKEREDYVNLRGMGDKPISVVPKAFATWVVSDRFPLVVRADLRHLLRAGGGTVGDLGAYLPLPGSSAKLAVFLGPSMTIGSRRYLRDLFGVSSSQAVAGGRDAYDIEHSGVAAMGAGLSATWRLSRHYLLNVDGALNWLGHEAADSPLVERVSAHALALSLDYRW